MPSALKYKTLTKPKHVFVLIDEGDVLKVYESKIDAQNDAIKYELTDYFIQETEFK